MRTALVAIFLMAIPGFALADPVNPKQLQQSDITYVGAFRLPHGIISPTTLTTFATNAGRGLSFDNRSPNGLFMAGNKSQDYLLEVPIPATLGNTATLTSIPQVSTLLQAPINIPGSTGVLLGSGGAAIPGASMGNNVLMYGTLLDDISGRLIGSTAVVYTSSVPSYRSHFTAPATWDTNSVASGMYVVGSTIYDNNALSAGFVGGYMTLIPSEWRDQFGGHTALTGQSTLAVTSRTSSGPAAFAFTPSQLGATGTEGNPTPAVPLMYYPAGVGLHKGWGLPGSIQPETSPGYYVDQSTNILYQYSSNAWAEYQNPWDGAMPSTVRTTLGLYAKAAASETGYYSKQYSEATEITGVVFPTGSQTVLFFGRQSVGSSCYGGGTWKPEEVADVSEVSAWLDANGTSPGYSCGSGHITVAAAESCCYDPAVGTVEGVHGYPYRYWAWAYNAYDLQHIYQCSLTSYTVTGNCTANPATGTAWKPWDAQPYGTWDITDMWPNRTLPASDIVAGTPVDLNTTTSASVSAGALTVTLADASGFNSSDSIEFEKGAANYEYNVVKSINGNVITLAYPMTKTHTSGSAVLRHVTGAARIMGAAYDPTAQRIYIAQDAADQSSPSATAYTMVQVLQLNLDGATPPATDGSCGTPNGLSLPSAPTVDLCSAGTASAVTGTGPFLWTCAGSGGGSTANCGATLLEVPPTGNAAALVACPVIAGFR